MLTNISEEKKEKPVRFPVKWGRNKWLKTKKTQESNAISVFVPRFPEPNLVPA